MTKANDINTLSKFLSHAQIRDLSKAQRQPTIILCVSAILHCAETLFSTLDSNPEITRTVILCGGMGHSTPHLYAAIKANPRYSHLYEKINGVPEAQVLSVILDECFDGKRIRESGVRVLVEDKSTNCGANATETRTLLEKLGVEIPERIVVIQDPTMSLRTKASFEKVFEGVEVLACPTFVPSVREVRGEVVFDLEGMGISEEEVWELDRFLGLVLGEVVRLRDDENGYGPKGKGFIGHVDVPVEVIQAYERLNKVVQGNR